MSMHYVEGGDHSETPQRPKGQSLPLSAWLDAAPAAWMLLLISAYAFLAMIDMVPTKRPVPGIPEADRLALPFLVLTVSAGIIRYFCLRFQERKANAASASSEFGRRDIA